MNSRFKAILRRHLVSFRRRPDLGSSRGSGLSSVAARCASTTRNNSNWIRLSSLRNKRPDLSGRPPCKGVAIGAARRTARLGGESTLRVPPCCSFPVSSQPLRRTARRIVRRWASSVRARRARACWCGETCRGRRARELAWKGVPQKRRRKNFRPKKDKGQRSKTRKKAACVPQDWGVLWRQRRCACAVILAIPVLCKEHVILSPSKNSVNATRFNFASRLLEVVDLALLARVM